jgi:hypothetical protein
MYVPVKKILIYVENFHVAILMCYQILIAQL